MKVCLIKHHLKLLFVYFSNSKNPVGRDVEFIKVGDIVSVPFNIACGRCTMCKEGKTGVCLNVNPARPGAAYG